MLKLEAVVVGAVLVASPGAEEQVARGIEALHDYDMARAREHFLAAQAAEPRSLMAYWGEAMTHFLPLWGAVGREEMRQVVAKAERSGAAPATEKEGAHWRALAALLEPEDEMDGRRRFSSALEDLARSDPADSEARAWLAHSQWGLWPEGLPEMESLERIAAIAQSVLADEPGHHGGLHYLIHALDTPDRAWRALAAAERYARIADSPHAHHMPSHIFLQLGMWNEVIESNERAWASSESLVQERGLSKEDLDFHAIDFLLYAQLQSDRRAEARETLSLLERISEELGSSAAWLPGYIASKEAVFIVETAGWEILPDSDHRGVILASALSSIHLDKPEVASSLVERCRANAERAETGTAEAFRWQAACDQAEGFLRFRRGERDRGWELLERARRHELRAGPAWETPDPVKPTTELLGEIYLELGRNQEAAALFSETLRRRPGRARALLGLARATGE